MWTCVLLVSLLAPAGADAVDGGCYLGRPGLPPRDLGADHLDYKGQGGGDFLPNRGNWVYWQDDRW